jgi:hypothetical protein
MTGIAERIAAEHVVWAAGAGVTARQVIEGVGQRWPRDRVPDWHDVALVIAIAWRRATTPELPVKRRAA